MVVASPAVCPRCGSVLVADGDRESVGQCLAHGSVYVPMVSMEVARGENEVPGGRVRRKASTPTNYSAFRDGCHVAPSCLRCPLERCVFDGADGHVPVGSERARSVGQQLQIERQRERAMEIIRVAREYGRVVAAERFGVTPSAVTHLRKRYADKLDDGIASYEEDIDRAPRPPREDPMLWLAWCVANGRPISVERLQERFPTMAWFEARDWMGSPWHEHLWRYQA